ncbi:MAG TPA: gluconate 2-dehydrogenase subunit 3 family protein [Vicinamibacteria bacterium]|nr:gluconate 2-dehydrogenase subunit 3 family protein [Vicinamibacteria bacterium]
MTVSRRDLLKLAAAAAATPLLPRSVAAAIAPSPGAGAVAAGRFFSAKEMALLDELVEMIIPADAHSGGARAAGVAAYIDGRLAEYDPSIASLKVERERWKAGLATVDALSRTKSTLGFLDTSPAERTALLERLDAALDDKALPTEEPEEGRQPNAEKPETAGQRFFVELKSWTTQGYYTSKIGIHDEMEYQGNKALVEFAGIDVATLPPVRPPED